MIHKLSGVKRIHMTSDPNSHYCDIQTNKFVDICELHAKYPENEYSFEALGMIVKVISKATNNCIGVVLLAYTTKIVLLPCNAKIILLNRGELRNLEVAIDKKYMASSVWAFLLAEPKSNFIKADKIIMSANQVDVYKQYAKSWGNNLEENVNIKIIEAIKDKIIFVPDWDYSELKSKCLDTTTGLFE